MVQGSAVTLRRPCDKASGVCAQQRERYHLCSYLSWTEAGRTHMLYVPHRQLKAFHLGVRAWSDFKRLAQQVARLNAQIFKAEKDQTR